MFYSFQLSNIKFFCFPKADGADNGVAKKALDDLKSENQLMKQKSKKLPTHDLMEKLSELFINDDSLYSTHIESEFLTKFDCKLDDNWLELVETSNRFKIEK